MNEPTFETPANFVNFGPSGVCHYRTILPARELKASMFVRDDRSFNTIARVGPQDPPVVVYSMPRSAEMLDEMEQLLTQGVKVIADVDDWMPAFVGKTDHPGGEGLYTPEFVQGHLDAVKRAHVVTASTPFIARQLSAMGCRDVHVVPNAVDIERWNVKKEPRHKSKTIIGWTGSVGHLNAVKEIVPAIERVMDERPDVAFADCGMPVHRMLREDLHPRCATTGFHPLEQHPYVISQFHINLGPTLDDDFYRAKSPLRALEAWASDSAFIGGRNTYGAVVEDGVTGLLADTPEEWYAALNRLLDDKVLNMRVRRGGMKRLRANHLMANTGPLWARAINAALVAE